MSPTTRALLQSLRRNDAFRVVSKRLAAWMKAGCPGLEEETAAEPDPPPDLDCEWNKVLRGEA